VHHCGIISRQAEARWLVKKEGRLYKRNAFVQHNPPRRNGEGGGKRGGCCARLACLRCLWFAVLMGSVPHPFLPRPVCLLECPVLIGRLLKFFLLAFFVVWLVRRIFSSQQQRTLHAWVVTLAQALIISAVLFAGLYALGVSLR